MEENQQLQDKVDELTAQNSQLTQDLDELDRLEQLYDLDQQYSEYDKVAAQVIAMDDENWFSTFTINRGTDDGIQVDCNVITEGGLVRDRSGSGKKLATVRSIIDDSSNVSAMTMSTSDRCIVSGDLRLINEGKLQFIHLKDNDDKIQEGEKIVTSDVSEKFLPGILIGYVSEIQEDPNNLTKTGTLTPVVDFEHIREVLVIKELKTAERGFINEDQKKTVLYPGYSGLLYPADYGFPGTGYRIHRSESAADRHHFFRFYAGKGHRYLDRISLRDTERYLLRKSPGLLCPDLSVHRLRSRMLHQDFYDEEIRVPMF